MKKIIIGLLLTSALVATASAGSNKNGLYLGAQAGYADVDNTLSLLGATPSDLNATVLQQSMLNQSSSIDDINWGGRLYLGYQFNRFLAAELGATGLEPSEVKNIYGSDSDEDVNQYYIDSVLKVMLPLGNRFDLFAKGGLAYVVSSHFSGDMTGGTLNVKSNDSESFEPTYGFGADFYLTKRLSADISWMDVSGSSDTPEIKLTMVGLAYHI